jgi:hypothetical protein
MEINRNRFIILPLLLTFLILFIFSLKDNAFTDEKKQTTQLSNSDCIKCHQNVVNIVEEKGSKHKTAVGCLDCHRGHPPMVSKEKIIPECSMCHSGKPHYQIGGCNTCHSNPHAPLDMKLASNITDPCLSCHPQQGNELKNYPSKHTKLFCTSCHAKHKQVPPCLVCHRPHTTEMVNKDCLVCHPAHQPLTITYGPDMPSKFCAPCHQKYYDTLLSTDTKHSKLACVFCHKEKHKMIPECQTCHGTPHPSAMLQKFPKCNMCHISAHSLGKEVKK